MQRSIAILFYAFYVLILVFIGAVITWALAKIGLFVGNLGFKEILPIGKSLWPDGLGGLTLGSPTIETILGAAVSILVLLIGLFVGITGYIFAMAVPLGLLIGVFGLVYDKIHN